MNTDRPRVVIIGSGFGGLFAAKALKRAPVDVTLLGRTGHHLFQPLLYQVATGILSEGEIAPATRDVLRKQKNARVLLGDVQRIDVEARTATSAPPAGLTVPPSDQWIARAGSTPAHARTQRPAARDARQRCHGGGRGGGSRARAAVTDGHRRGQREPSSSRGANVEWSGCSARGCQPAG